MSKTHDVKYFNSIIRVLKAHGGSTLLQGEILDVGCGSGSLAKVLSSRFVLQKRIVGLDVSTLGNPQKSLRFVEGNAENLPFSESKFDIVFLVDVLEHIPRPERAISEACRVLKKGGLLLIRTPNYLSPLLNTFGFAQLKRGMYKRLRPDLSKDVIGGDRDAVSGIFVDKLQKALIRERMIIEHSETWGGGPAQLKFIQLLNHLPVVGSVGTSVTLLARKNN